MTATSREPIAPDPRLEQLLRRTVLLAAAIVVCAPGARGDSVWFGALPLWLLGMPLLSWWALHRFRLPARDHAARAPRRRRSPVQARRRPDARPPLRLPHAA
jgi:hypothetical protein